MPTLAKTISTPSKPVVVVDGKTASRICYYQDQAYSEGAYIQVGEIYLVCAAAKNFETNGALKWYEVTKKASE
ncbi:DUF1496 domain-containing protein [Vibrio sp. SCSIO 43136]|uniref:DUF1496 domain-containing protein n=1 Tax=Vibrio sp. SCSIO 43136 TaxID=2819101 RepID=UPI00207605F1|nr:DUF1496 domain-containing protein [Vibrio sp. SCSIO 43136]